MLPFELADEHGQCEAREMLKFVPPEIQHCKVWAEKREVT